MSRSNLFPMACGGHKPEPEMDKVVQHHQDIQRAVWDTLNWIERRGDKIRKVIAEEIPAKSFLPTKPTKMP